MTKSVRDSFVAHFGETQALAFEAAAEHHAHNSSGENRGSDEFKWVILMTIGAGCFSNANYREWHGITAPVDVVRTWIYSHGELATHDGDFDAMAMLCGWYKPYVPAKLEGAKS